MRFKSVESLPNTRWGHFHKYVVIKDSSHDTPQTSQHLTRGRKAITGWYPSANRTKSPGSTEIISSQQLVIPVGRESHCCVRYKTRSASQAILQFK